MTNPEQVRRAFLEASLQRELRRATAEQERAITNRLDGKRGRQLVRRFPKVEITLIYDSKHWADVIQNALRCWYDLTFIVAVQPTLDSRLMNYSEKWGDEAARTFAIAHSARTTARLERRFIAIAAPATQLPLLDAIALLKEEASYIFLALRSEIPELARYETQRALNDILASLVSPASSRVVMPGRQRTSLPRRPGTAERMTARATPGPHSGHE